VSIADISDEKSCVIGTDEAEINRLGLQHRVWRASVLNLVNLLDGYEHDQDALVITPGVLQIVARKHH
jgi:hypothetical protein